MAAQRQDQPAITHRPPVAQQARPDRPSVPANAWRAAVNSNTVNDHNSMSRAFTSASLRS